MKRFRRALRSLPPEGARQCLRFGIVHARADVLGDKK
jgi:hypothetical protein